MEERKKDRKAVALSYEPEYDAPKVVASGKGYLADKIIEAADEAAVPVHEDAGLADALSEIQIGDSIPPELYEVVAEILVFVDDMDKIKHKIDGKKGKAG